MRFMRKAEREKIASRIAEKAEVEKTKLATLLELEIDEVAKAEEDAITRIDKELERKINSPKRKTRTRILYEKAELAKQTIKTRTAEKIAKLKMRADTSM
jgi:chromosomal replication initiation ATPase DnaA